MDKKRENALGSLLSTTLKIGLIGFGGGSALIPAIQKNVVEDKGLVTPEEYEEDVMIASVTPGALPVEISGCIGKRIGGWKGMLLGAMGMAFPGVFLTLLLLSFISYVNEAVLQQIQFIAVGITAFIACLLTDYVKGTIVKADVKADVKAQRWQNVVIIVLVFGLTCGKNIYRIFDLEGRPAVSLSNIQIFGAAFFILLLAQCRQSIVKLCKKQATVREGQTPAQERQIPDREELPSVQEKQIPDREELPSVQEKQTLDQEGQAFAREKQMKTGKNISGNSVKQMWSELTALAILLAATGGVAFLATSQSLTYLWNGFLSSVMSFGGGDAYLTVAEGLFVETALVTEEEFYGQLVPLVNVLPGSILCKTLSGIGFYLGLNRTGSLLAAYAVAAAGFACSIFGSCGVVSVAGCFYKSFEDLLLFRGIRRWIRPIVAGLMLNVILALVYQNCKIGSFPVILMIVIYMINTYLYHFKKTGNGKLVFLSIGLSVVFCNISTLVF